MPLRFRTPRLLLLSIAIASPAGCVIHYHYQAKIIEIQLLRQDHRVDVWSRIDRAVESLGYRLTTPLVAQDVNQGSTKVLTRMGYRDRAHVHQIPEGYDLIRMPDGHMRAENTVTGNYIDFADSIDTDAKVPFTDNGWITCAGWLNRTKPQSSQITGLTAWSISITNHNFGRDELLLVRIFAAKRLYIIAQGFNPASGVERNPPSLSAVVSGKMGQFLTTQLHWSVQ
jgi:hypothetical protein